MSETLVKSMTGSLINLIKDTFTSFDVRIVSETKNDQPKVVLVKQGTTPSKTFIAISYIRHKPLSGTASYSSNIVDGEFVTRYQIPYESTAAIMVIGELAEEMSMALQMRMKFSKSARSNFIRDNLAITQVGEITDSDIKNDTSDYVSRRRFLCTIKHVVGFEESANYTKQVQIVDVEKPEDILIINDTQE